MIICVEDEQNICELEVYTLESVGLEAMGVGSGKELFAELERMADEGRLPELVLLDIMLPDEDGLSILRRLRGDGRFGAVPVIMATAKGAEFDKVKGLDAGADDYIVKPFGMLELVARIKAVLRRCNRGADADGGACVAVGNVEIDATRHVVKVDGAEVVLTLKEFELLRKLASNPGIVFTRDRLLNDIWGYDFYGETRTIDVHIRTLRQKLGSAGEMVETIRGVGYRWTGRG